MVVYTSNPQTKHLGFYIYIYVYPCISRMLCGLSLVSLALPNLECLWGTGGLYGIKELLLFS